MPSLPPHLLSLLRSLRLHEDQAPDEQQWQVLLKHLALSEQQEAGLSATFTPLFEADTSNRIAQWSAAAQQVLGYGPEIAGQDVKELVPLPLEKMRFGLLLGAVRDSQQSSDHEFLFVGADGKHLLLTCRFAAQPVTGAVRIAGNLAGLNREQSFLGRRQFYEAVLNELPAPVALFSPDQRYVFCNPTSIRNPAIREWIIGKSDREYVNYRHFDPALATQRERHFQQAIAERRTIYFEERMTTPAGEIQHQLRTFTPFFDQGGKLLFVIGHGMDITALKRTQEALTHLNNELEGRVQARTAELEAVTRQLQYEAFHDSLTGLPNRAFFTERLNDTIVRSLQNPEMLYAVLFLDTDRFKGVNDTLGHPTGDALLIELARRLRRILRDTDTVARFGGDEFAVLLDPLDQPEQASTVAQRIQSELRRPMTLDGFEVAISASIGVVLGESSYTTTTALLRDADIAMYRAKAAGRARSQVFTPEMRRETMEMNRLENQLRVALQRQELRVVYQSIVELGSLRVSGVEALIRWQHPERGLLLPATFLHVAEESGLLLEMDRWVLRRACEDVQQWQERSPGAAPLELSVNLTGQHFATPGFGEWLRQTLAETGFDPARLNLEITEGVLLATPEAIGQTLQDVRAMGVGLHLDDFGTGYSALSYLHTYPLDTLKIDRSFVGGMLENKGSAELVRTIVAMAKNMQLDVVAEGIENQEQLDILRELGCTYGQGYLFAQPHNHLQDSLEQLLNIHASKR